MTDRDAEAMLDELAEVAAQLEHHATEADRLYKRRVELMLALRSLDPPVTQRRIAEVAGMAPGAVNQALLKERRRRMAS